MLNLVVCCSGAGSNLVAIYNSINNGILIADIACVIINKKDSRCIEFCIENNIKYRLLEWDRYILSRAEYDAIVLNNISVHKPDLIVLAGWMHIIHKEFINTFKNIINLHPALPNTFIGINSIENAYDAFQKGEISYTGSMVHRVIEEVDKGEVLEQIIIPINNTDTLEQLESRVKLYEKGIMISAIQKFIVEKNKSLAEPTKEIYKGKVRNVENIGYRLLLMEATNRISAFDRHLCDIPSKGIILNNISKYWFNKTKDIIDNHYLFSKGEYMIVKKTKPIKLEIIVRAYMTGSTSTSIWTHYNKGERELYGIKFRDGYKKNEKLDNIIITPTTKGTTDRPITREEIIDSYITESEYDYIHDRAMELFKYGQKLAEKRGLILVDTKYEFGYLPNNDIILIDELHTCDSSRYWVLDTYTENLKNGKEPDKLDKDAIRDWVKTKCDPYNKNIDIPNIPIDVIENVENVYKKYYNMITNYDITNNDSSIINKSDIINYYFNNIINHFCIIFAGSVKDTAHVENIKSFLEKNNIYCVNYYCSAHKETKKLLEIMGKYEYMDRKIVYITCAGRSNALSGVVASNSKFPVIACPVFKDKVDMGINIHSTIQCPSKVPVMTILEPENVAMAINKLWYI